MQYGSTLHTHERDPLSLRALCRERLGRARITASLTIAAVLVLTAPLIHGESGPTGDGTRKEERVAFFEDTQFRRGFNLAFPSIAKGHAVEKVLPGGDATTRPAWLLCEWATRASLVGAPRLPLADGATSYADATKRVVFGGGAAGGPDLVLELRAGDEYQGRARAAGELWPHLLVEQEATRVITIDRLVRLELDIDLRLSAFADRRVGRAAPGLHAAQLQLQLQLFLIVKDMAPVISARRSRSSTTFWRGRCGILASFEVMRSRFLSPAAETFPDGSHHGAVRSDGRGRLTPERVFCRAAGRVEPSS